MARHYFKNVGLLRAFSDYIIHERTDGTELRWNMHVPESAVEDLVIILDILNKLELDNYNFEFNNDNKQDDWGDGISLVDNRYLLIYIDRESIFIRISLHTTQDAAELKEGRFHHSNPNSTKEANEFIKIHAEKREKIREIWES